MEGIRVCYQPAFGEGDIAHVLDGGAAGTSAVDLWSPGWGLDKVFGKCGFFGPDTTAEGKLRGRANVVRGGNVDSCGTDALVLDLQVRLIVG